MIHVELIAGKKWKKHKTHDKKEKINNFYIDFFDNKWICLYDKTDILFGIAPRINAAGRISDAKLATKLLTTKNLSDAEKYANKLETLNMERKNLEQSVLNSALLQAKIQQESGANILWMFEKGWHPGVIGIVASRIKETFKN